MTRAVQSGQQGASPPRLSKGTELIGEYKGSGFKDPFYLARRADGQVVRFSRLLYLVASEADGQQDFDQIARRVSEKFGRTVSADNVRFLVEERLQPLGVLAVTGGTSHQPAKLPRAKPVLALHWRAPILPMATVRVLATIFRPLFFAPVVLTILAAFAVFDIWLFVMHGLGQSTRQLLYQPELFLMVVGLGFLSGLFHECGHATGLHYSGAKPSSVGVGLYLVWPVFYADVTDAYRLGRAGRLRVDLGGVYFNIVFALATAGIYFLSGFEPLLLVIFLLQVQMLYQFMPFVRLDGYYLVSDITGVPDLFTRIKPTLKSLVPGREPDKRVQELKPWVRLVVTAWVISAIPVLFSLFTLLVISAPALFATAWDSFLGLQGEVRAAFEGGRAVDGVACLIRIVLLIIPVVGTCLVIGMAGWRSGTMVWRLSKGRLALRMGLAAIVVASGAILTFVWWPHDNSDNAIQWVERVTAQYGTP